MPWRARWVTGLLAVLLLCSFGVSAAPATAVLYPELREPYRSVLLSIINGINDELGGTAELRPIGDGETVADVSSWAEHSGVKTVIVLGKYGEELCRLLSGRLTVVIGATQVSPETESAGYRGIALTPDPRALLSRLKTITPRVSHVIVVYRPEVNGWVITRARLAAADLGLTLEAVPVKKLQDAANQYREILDRQESGTDALWLPQDNVILDERAVLPMILEQAWNRKLTVFSSNPSHVKRGALFALYPNNYQMGRSLARLALEPSPQGSSDSVGGIEPLRDLLVAINMRTAGHLGLNFSRNDMKDFDLVLPTN